ncbi:MAG: hypothetical protein K6U89_06190 [Chloroflexi bacterium]|nr:hypothetical protein [Chloroflexota bacterium]
MKRYALLLAVSWLSAGCALGSASIAPTATPAAVQRLATATPPPAVASPTPPAPAGQGAIVITSPSPGATVRGPLRVTGTASVFEGTVHVRLRAASGQVIAQTTTTASVGAPGRGTFTVELTVRGSGPATVEAYTLSPRDGSEQELVRVPVTLAP